MQTIEDKAEDSVAEIPLSVSEDSEGNIYYFIDTNDPNVVTEQVTNWYTEVQTPQETANQEEESQRTGGTRQQRASGRRSRETQNQEGQPREP